MTWERSDLDIFVGHREAEGFMNYLLEEEGYRQVYDRSHRWAYDHSKIEFAIDAFSEVRYF